MQINSHSIGNYGNDVSITQKNELDQRNMIFRSVIILGGDRGSAFSQFNKIQASMIFEEIQKRKKLRSLQMFAFSANGGWFNSVETCSIVHYAKLPEKTVNAD